MASPNSGHADSATPPPASKNDPTAIGLTDSPATDTAIASDSGAISVDAISVEPMATDGDGHHLITIPWHSDGGGPVPTADGPVRNRWRKVAGRTLSKAWSDSLFGMSSQAAFWTAMSTAPFLLALLGLSGIFTRWLFGPEGMTAIREQASNFLNTIFNEEVANNLHRQHHRHHSEQRSDRRDLGGIDHQPVGRLVGDVGLRRIDHHRLLPARGPAPGTGTVLRPRSLHRRAARRDRRPPAARHRPGATAADCSRIPGNRSSR